MPQLVEVQVGKTVVFRGHVLRGGQQVLLTDAEFDALSDAALAVITPVGGKQPDAFLDEVFVTHAELTTALDSATTALLSWAPGTIGRLYNGNPPGTGTRNGGNLADVAYLNPLYSGPDGITLDLFDCNVQTLQVGGLYRMGVWIVDDQTRPFKWALGTQYATLSRDLGTVVMDTTGVKTITPGTPVTIPPRTWWAIGGAQQGAAGGLVVIGNGVTGFNPLGGSNTSHGVGGVTTWLRMAAAGAFPAAYTPDTTAVNVGHGVGFRRSA